MNFIGRRPHEFETRPGGWKRCRACGFDLHPDADPLPMCPGDPEERKGLGRSGTIERKTPLKPVSETNSDGPPTFTDLSDFARDLGCTVGHHPEHRCWGRIEAHHVRSRGAGYGDWVEGEGNVVGLCAGAHREIHRQGQQTFERTYEINLAARAATIGDRYRSAHGTEAGPYPGGGGDHG